MIKHFKDSKERLLYLKSNPIWISIHTKICSIFSYSTLSNGNPKGVKSSTPTSLNPWYITGLADGEGCFTASLMCYLKGMWGLQPQFELK